MALKDDLEKIHKGLEKDLDGLDKEMHTFEENERKGREKLQKDLVARDVKLRRNAHAAADKAVKDNDKKMAALEAADIKRATQDKVQQEKKLASAAEARAKK